MKKLIVILVLCILALTAVYLFNKDRNISVDEPEIVENVETKEEELELPALGQNENEDFYLEENQSSIVDSSNINNTTSNINTEVNSNSNNESETNDVSDKIEESDHTGNEKEETTESSDKLGENELQPIKY